MAARGRRESDQLTEPATKSRPGRSWRISSTRRSSAGLSPAPAGALRPAGRWRTCRRGRGRATRRAREAGTETYLPCATQDRQPTHCDLAHTGRFSHRAVRRAALLAAPAARPRAGPGSGASSGSSSAGGPSGWSSPSGLGPSGPRGGASGMSGILGRDRRLAHAALLPAAPPAHPSAAAPRGSRPSVLALAVLEQRDHVPPRHRGAVQRRHVARAAALRAGSGCRAGAPGSRSCSRSR